MTSFSTPPCIFVACGVTTEVTVRKTGCEFASVKAMAVASGQHLSGVSTTDCWVIRKDCAQVGNLKYFGTELVSKNPAKKKEKKRKLKCHRGRK